MKGRVSLAAVVLLVTCLAPIVGAEVRFGVLAQRSPETTLKEWEPLAAYLTQRVGEKVTIIPLRFEEVLDFCRDEPTGFLFANSWFVLKAKVLRKAGILSTARMQGSGSLFGGVIFALRGR